MSAAESTGSSVSVVRLNVNRRTDKAAVEPSAAALPPLPLHGVERRSTSPTGGGKKRDEPPQTPGFYKRISLPSVHPRKQLQKKFNQLALPPVSTAPVPAPRRPAAAKGLMLALKAVRQFRQLQGDGSSAADGTTGHSRRTLLLPDPEPPTELLSDELLLHIFSYLSQTELATRVALVCKRWCKLSRDKSLWPEINLAAIPERERSGVMERLGGGFKVLRIERFIDLQHAARFCPNIVYLNLCMTQQLHTGGGGGNAPTGLPMLLLAAAPRPVHDPSAPPVGTERQQQQQPAAGGMSSSALPLPPPPLPRIAEALAAFRQLKELHIYPSALDALPPSLPAHLSRLEVLRLIGRRLPPPPPPPQPNAAALPAAPPAVAAAGGGGAGGGGGGGGGALLAAAAAAAAPVVGGPAAAVGDGDDAEEEDGASGNVGFLPSTISRFVRLYRLTLYNNSIGALPPEIGSLTTLVKLNLSINCIAELPPQIATLTALRWLSVSSNRLTRLPAELAELSELRFLNLEDNRFSHIPAGFSRLTNLETLCLAGNKITSIHADFKRLTSVRSLTISYSSFTSLPQEVGAWPNLRFINYCHPDLVFSAFTLTHPLLARTRLKYLLQIEADNPFDPTYLSRQLLISSSMRERLVEWIGLQIVKLPAGELEPSHIGMLFAAINVVDRYLSKKLIDPLLLQLLGIVALYLGSQLFTHPDAANAITKEAFLARFDEQFSPELFDYMEQQVRQAGVLINAPTVLQFYKYYVVACEMQSCIDQYPLQILLEYDFLKFKPSALAVTCVYAERLRSFEFYRNVGLWITELEVLSGQTLRDVHAMVRIVVDLFVARKIEERTESAEVIAKQVLRFD